MFYRRPSAAGFSAWWPGSSHFPWPARHLEAPLALALVEPGIGGKYWVCVFIIGNVVINAFCCRVFHASAREGHMVKVFSYISISRATPLPPILLQVPVNFRTERYPPFCHCYTPLIFQALIALFMIAVGGITSLIDYTSFLSWLFLAMSFMSLLVFRKTKKNEHRPYKVQYITP